MATRINELSSHINPQDEDITNDQQNVRTANSLFRQKLYNIPEYMRDKVLQSAVRIMDSQFSEDKDKIMAARLILEADKRNLELLKIITPKAHLHVSVKELPTKEILKILREAQLDAQKILPLSKQEIIDVELS